MGLSPGLETCGSGLVPVMSSVVGNRPGIGIRAGGT